MMNRTTSLGKALLLGAAGMALSVPVSEAQTFTYTPRDLILSFRQIGNATDVVIDVGQASSYYGAAPGSSIDLTSFYNPASLQSLYGVSLANVNWSVAGATAAGDSGSAVVPDDTLWVTRARNPLTPDVQTSPWAAKSSFSQNGTGARIIGIANGAVSQGTAGLPPFAVSYSTIPDANAQSYHTYVGATLGNYQNTFQGNVENNTTTGSTRSDLYELRPASGNPNGTYLGYFEFNSSGAMTFTAVPEPGTWAMVGLGALMLVSVQRIRRQA